MCVPSTAVGLRRLSRIQSAVTSAHDSKRASDIGRRTLSIIYFSCLKVVSFGSIRYSGLRSLASTLEDRWKIAVNL